MLQLVRAARQNVFMRTDPLVQHNTLTTAWLLQALAEASPQSGEEQETMINPATLKEWKDRGLISYRWRNRPDPHQASALLIARLVDKRQRNWLPTAMTTDEARS